MRYKAYYILFTFVVIVAGTLNSLSQTEPAPAATPPLPSFPMSTAPLTGRDDFIRESYRAYRREAVSKGPDNAAMTVGNNNNTGYEYKAPALSDNDRRRFQIGDDLTNEHKGFLSQKGTGIFKLIAPTECVGTTDKQKAACALEMLAVYSHANHFSFRKDNHSPTFRDVSLTNGKLVPSTNYVQTIFVKLDGQQLADLDATSPGMDFLREFSPAVNVAGFDEQSKSLEDTIRSGDFTYSRSASLKVGDVFGLRVVAYKNKVSGRSSEATDMLIVLEVVKVDDDGSPTIVWKQIDRSKGPELKRR